MDQTLDERPIPLSGETTLTAEECEVLTPLNKVAVKKQKESANWIGIEAQYRLGLLSNVQIAQNYGITEGAIRKMAKKYGWVKDLSSQVREKVRDKLVRAERAMDGMHRARQILERARVQRLDRLP